MNVILKLGWNDLMRRKTRCALTIGAVAISVSLVVAMTSGFATLRDTAHGVLGDLYGKTDVTAEPSERGGLYFNTNFVEQLKSDPRVRSVQATLTTIVQVQDADDPQKSRYVQLIGIDERYGPGEGRRRPLVHGQWFTDDEQNVAAVDQRLVTRFGWKPPALNRKLKIVTAAGERTVTVCAVTKPPPMSQLRFMTVFLPLRQVQDLEGRPGRFNQLKIELHVGKETEAFADSLEAMRIPDNPVPLVKTAAKQKDRFDRNFEGLGLLSYLGGSVSMIAAVFIIFSTLMMGVSERSRLLAMLRAIGAERRQVAGIVIWEGLLLSLVGSVVGVLLGILWVHLFIFWLIEDEVRQFVSDVTLNWNGILFGVLGSILAAVIASALPAYAASRVRPLEAMTVVAKSRSPVATWICAAIGLMLLLVDPAIIYAPGIDREMRIPLHVYLGLPCFMIGLFLLSPAIVFLIDRLLSPVTAWLLGLKPSLLRQQLAGGLWRSAGTASALMVGLAVLILIRVHGSNMINTWQLPDKFPDLLIGSWLTYSEEQIRALDEIEEIADGQVFPVAFPTADLQKRLFGLGGLIDSPNATMMFGLDVEMVIGNQNARGEPLVELEYLEGDRDESIRLMRSGRYLLVSEEFRTLEGLGVGDTLTIDTPVHGPVDYTIAGVVRSPGIDLIVRVFQAEKEFNRWTSSAAATDLENLKKDFAITRFNVMGANLIEGDRSELENRAREKLSDRGFTVMGSDWIKDRITFGLNAILHLCSSVALMSILVASIGVTNTIMSSLRSRRWHLGVLRAIGLTRGALLRLVMAEAILIALAACVLGLGGGLLLSYSSDGMAGHVVGISPDFQIHFAPFLLGAGVTISVAIAAGLWPAFHTASTAPLNLLQAGRAAG